MLAMFVKTTRRRRGDKTYAYLSLVESVREGGKVGHRTLLRLGEVSELRASGQLDRIIRALRSHAEGGWLSADELSADSAPAVGGMEAVWAYFSRLGLPQHLGAVGSAKRLSYDLAGAAFVMVANRLLDPSSKRRIPEWLGADVLAPTGVAVPSLDQLYRGLDQVAGAKEQTEAHLYARLTDLTNLDLRLVCYDLTSTYFETTRGPSPRFPSRAFGYSRDRRPDRPQVVIGLLCTSDGLPIAHQVFSGNTGDVSTLPGVLSDLQRRFGVGRITVVADRAFLSEANLEALSTHSFYHVLATKLHRQPLARAAIEASASPEATWVPVPDAHSAACEVTLEGTRCVVVVSAQRLARDHARRAQLLARTEAQLLELEDRVRTGRLRDQRRIAGAAARILASSGIGRLFDLEIGPGRFLYHYDEDALDYEELVAGRYVLTTSLPPEAATTADVVLAYRTLQQVEDRFRVLKDFLHLRPVYHWTERRVRGHVAVCVYASLIEALIARDLRAADLRDPDLPDQHLSAARALRELERIRRVTLQAGDRTIHTITRRSPLQARILTALGVDTRSWDRAHIA